MPSLTKSPLPVRHRAYVHMPKDSPYWSMAPGGTIARSRLVMAQHLGRCLLSVEYVRHKDGDEANDDISNLELTDRDRMKIQWFRTMADRRDLQGRHKEALYLRKAADKVEKRLRPLASELI